MSAIRSDLEARVHRAGRDARQTRQDVGEVVRSLTPVRYASVPRRWPWALGAAVLGAAAGAGAVLALRHLMGQDAPDAQEPEQLKAVVDTDVAAS